MSMILSQRIVSLLGLLLQTLKTPALKQRHLQQSRPSSSLQFISSEEGAANTQPLRLQLRRLIKRSMLTLTCLWLPLIQTLSCGGEWSIEWQEKDLCICGTSVPPQRVFSTAGHVCNDSRSRLLPKNVNKLVHHYYMYMYVIVVLWCNNPDTCTILYYADTHIP